MFVSASRSGTYVHPFIDAIPEHPAILQVIKELDDSETFGGEFWHCDISFTSPPAAVSILHACELPPIGGDTLFANTALAFDRLSPRPAVGLRTHRYARLPGEREGPSRQRRTRSRIHPLTGRRALYVNPAFVTRIEELEHAESDALLPLRPPDPARVPGPSPLGNRPGGAVGQPHDRAHAMNDYPGHRRRLQRVTAIEQPG